MVVTDHLKDRLRKLKRQLRAAEEGERLHTVAGREILAGEATKHKVSLQNQIAAINDALKEPDDIETPS